MMTKKWRRKRKKGAERLNIVLMESSGRKVTLALACSLTLLGDNWGLSCGNMEDGCGAEVAAEGVHCPGLILLHFT